MAYLKKHKHIDMLILQNTEEKQNKVIYRTLMCLAKLTNTS